MINIRAIQQADEYRSLKEEKESLEKELYLFKKSYGTKKPTYEDLEKEVEYMEKIDWCNYRIGLLKDDYKIALFARIGISLAAISALMIALLATRGCSKVENKTSNMTDETSYESIEDEESLNKVLKF